MKPSDFCDQVVLPALFERLDSAFPEFGWKRSGAGWVASTWPSDFPYSVEHENPDRLAVYADRPWRIKVHGHDGVPLVAYVNGGRSPQGADYWTAVRELARRAGVDASPIERAPSAEETKAARERQTRGDALAVVIEYGTETLWSDAGTAARAYLASRGFTDDEIRSLGLGLYRSVADVSKRLRAAGIDREASSKVALEWAKLEGYILVPWHDAHGQPLTLYGRWATKTPPEGTPKTIALPGEGTKRDPLYFNRALKAGHRELVVVEGVFDAAMLQVRGDTRVVASVAAQLNGNQLEGLVRHQIQTVYICGDPDGGGIRGNVANVRELEKRGIRTFVVEQLPDGLDPDEYVLREGIEAWRARVANAEPGRVHQTRHALAEVTPESTTAERRALARAAMKLVGTFDPLDREDAVKLVAERTGYTFDTLAELLEEPASEDAPAGETADVGDEPSTEEAPEPNAAPRSPWDERWGTLADDTFSAAPPPREWLLSHVLPLGKVGMLVAEGGAGKTMALCQLALAVATGRAWLGMPVANPGRVLLVLGEEDAEEVRRRMFNAARSMKLTSEETRQTLSRIFTMPLAGVPCAMLDADERGTLSDSAFKEWLSAKLGEPSPDPWRLLAFDPLSRFAGADAEKDNAAATRFIQSIEALAGKTGATALVAHHSNKASRKEGDASTSAARGSSALTDGVRWVATLSVETLEHEAAEARERLSRVVTLAVTKSNYARHAEAVTLRYDNDHGGALVPLDASDLKTYVTPARARERDDETRKKRVEVAAMNAETKKRAEERRAKVGDDFE